MLQYLKALSFHLCTKKNLFSLTPEFYYYTHNKMFNWPNTIFLLKIFGLFNKIFFFNLQTCLVLSNNFLDTTKTNFIGWNEQKSISFNQNIFLKPTKCSQQNSFVQPNIFS